MKSPYWSEELCFVTVPIKGEKRDLLHLIDEEIALANLSRKKIKRHRLALATKPYDVFFLCVVPSIHLDNCWNSTALKACREAQSHWVQVSSRKDERHLSMATRPTVQKTLRHFRLRSGRRARSTN